MGKTKQAKEKKFDRNVEISAPILDPEIIKAIHTPPKGQRLDLKHGGFKALLSDLNQDSTDELTPLNDNHVPSYISISCAVSGYSNYSSYSKRPNSSATNRAASTPNRSRANSPLTLQKTEHQVHHITIDKNNIHSADEERKELTEKLTASASERRRSPSPCIPPTEDDRHHGAYVGARYCPLPPPDKEVNKHIPLLGIDDDQNPDDIVEDDQNKVEQKIASLYGDNFAEGWRESMTHKAKKELTPDEVTAEQQALKSPKDLVTLKPASPSQTTANESSNIHEVDVPTPNVRVLASVEKQFLNKLLTDENPPVPSQTLQPGSISPTRAAPSPSPIEDENQYFEQQQSQSPPSVSPSLSPSSPPPPQTKAPGIGNHNLETGEERGISNLQAGVEHIEYEIRAQSPIDNDSSPVKIPHHQDFEEEDSINSVMSAEQKLVSFSSEPPVLIHEEITQKLDEEGVEVALKDEKEDKLSPISDSNKDGRYYLDLLDKEKSFITEQINEAEATLANQEAELDDETVGRIRSAIGKANLLVNKKCNQFKELCEANINKDSNEQFATLNDDLAGFWDMLTIQVSDVRKSFETLWEAKESDWKVTTQQDDEEESHDLSLRDNKTSVKAPKLSLQKDQERRERLQEHINQMKQNQATKSSAENLLNRDFELENGQSIAAGAGLQASESQALADNFEVMAPEVSEADQEEQMFSLIGGMNSATLDSDAGNSAQKIESSENQVSDLVDL